MKPIKAEWICSRYEKFPVTIIKFIADSTGRIYAICCWKDRSLHKIDISDLLITDEEILPDV